MLKFLNKPYPFNDDLQYNAKLILFISMGVLLFLLFFQPIDIRSLSNKEIFYLIIGVAASTFLVLSFNLIILPSLFPKIFESRKWNIKREIIWNIWILLTISASDFIIYTKLLGVINISFIDVAKLILLGFLPVSAIIIVNHNRLLKAHLKSAQELTEQLLLNKQQKEKLIHFKSEYKKDELTIKPDDIILIKSSDNYIEIYYSGNQGVKKQIIRSTLKRAEETIHDIEYIFQCHRTYIINIHKVKEIQGNSQGYKLFFDNIEFQVPVSQKYINEFKKLIQKG